MIVTLKQCLPSSNLVVVFASHSVGLRAWAQQYKAGNYSNEEKPANNVIPQRHPCPWPKNAFKRIFYNYSTFTTCAQLVLAIVPAERINIIMFKPECDVFIPVLGLTATKWPISSHWAWYFHRRAGAYHWWCCRCTAFITFKLWNEGYDGRFPGLRKPALKSELFTTNKSSYT